LSLSNHDTWTQDSPGIEGGAEAGDQFGFALAAADFDGNGYDDLAVGVPYESVTTTSGAQDDAGAVNVIYAAYGGLDDAGNQLWTQSSENILGVAEAGDRFGYALAAAPIRPQAHTANDQYIDLAIGIPGRVVGPTVNAGAVNVVFGWSEGITDDGSQYLNQFTVSGDSPDSNDEFGKRLAAGDFDGDGHDDLAIGVPQEDTGSLNNDGAVQVLWGTRDGLTDEIDQLWRQDLLAPELSEDGDMFGNALQAGNFNGDEYMDLAIGASFEDRGAAIDAGVVHVLYGSGTLFTGAGSAVLQNAAPSDYDYYGSALAAGDFDANGCDDLAIAEPYGNFASTNDVGVVFVYYGTTSGISLANNRVLSLNNTSSFVPAADDHFGYALVALTRRSYVPSEGYHVYLPLTYK
jgi:hypothetical protein